MTFLSYITFFALIGCDKEIVWNKEKKPEVLHWSITTQNINQVIMTINIKSDSEIKSSLLIISKDDFLTNIEYQLDFSNNNKQFVFYIEDIENGIYSAKIYLENDLGTIEYKSGVDAFSIGVEHSVGDDFQGGVIAYLFKEDDLGYDPQKQKGLIVPEEDFTRTKWGCQRDISGTKLSLGYGRANTLKVIKVCNRKKSAIGICNNFTKNGFNDWFLPSKNEMEKVYSFLQPDVSNLEQSAYWTSSQSDKKDAFIYHPLCENSNSCNIPKKSLVQFIPMRYMK